MKKIYYHSYSQWFCVVWFLLGACTDTGLTPTPSNLNRAQPDLEITTQPTLPVPMLNLEEIASGQAMSYRNIIPGLSHKQDVINQWGEPNVIRTHESYESLHYFSSGSMEYVLIQDGNVQAITSKAREIIVYQGLPAEMEDLSDRLQAPNIITYTFRTPVYVYPDFGLAVSGFPKNIQVYQFFAPTNFQEYQNLWGKYPIEYDPFPLIPSVDSVAIEPGTTTREQLALLLGNPDRIVFEDPNAPWLYDLEPDFLGRLDIFFNNDDTIRYMGTSGGTKPILLEEIINSFGSPDIIQLLPDEHGIKYGYGSLGLVYLERGLRVATNCVPQTCEVVKKDARIEQKWYFQPTSFEEYKQIFPESAFIDWQGFSD
jgi:hypothetical protein